MLTVDQLLLKIVNFTEPTVEATMLKRDAKVLRSLATTANSSKFITENQSRLLLKILRENSKNLRIFSDDIDDILATPLWSKVFRPVDLTKKLFVETTSDHTHHLTIEFAFNSQIRKILQANTKKITGLVQSVPGKIYHADLTERNIVEIVELLTPYGFDIEEKIQDFYKTIKSWSKIEVESQFLITNIEHQNFQKAITSDLGVETKIDNNILVDRSMRYQYFLENTEKTPENLTEKLAFRENTKIWIDSKQYQLSDVIESLLNLKRFPVLVVFDQYNEKVCLENLQNLSKILEKNGIFDNVGIYFRLPNNEVGTKFNKIIADKKYNSQLDENTKVVAVQSGKIPKFFLKTDWKPMSVVSINTQLRHSKTAVYASCCDLIISYTEQQPIIEAKSEWQ